MTRSSSVLAIGALLLAASSIAVPAAAQPADQAWEQPTRITVSYADLDISRPAGAAVLLRRVRSAAVRACGGMPDARVLDQFAAFEHCRREAVSRAVAQVNSPVLNALMTKRRSASEFASR
ncbi:MAG TPA: UrcA family protein [Caulobacteraceae bacterium]|nr:UrcA family protein [Caulobacteraceae bacterium]